MWPSGVELNFNNKQEEDAKNGRLLTFTLSSHLKILSFTHVFMAGWWLEICVWEAFASVLAGVEIWACLFNRVSMNF